MEIIKATPKPSTKSTNRDRIPWSKTKGKRISSQVGTRSDKRSDLSAVSLTESMSTLNK